MNLPDDLLFQHLKIGVALVETDGICIKINDAMCDILGYGQEEVLNTDLSRLIHPDDLPESNIEFVQIFNTNKKQSTSEYRYVHKMGHVIWASRTISMYKINKSSPPISIIQIQDITERKRAEIDLCETETFARSLFEQALVGIYLSQKGKIQYINPYLAGIFGYTHEEILQHRVTDFILKEDYISIIKKARKILLKNEMFKFNVRGRKKDKSIIFLEGHCSRAYYKGKLTITTTIHDVTYKKQTDKLLYEHVNRYEKLLEYMPEPIIVYEDGVISFANIAALQLFEADDDSTAIIGKNIFDFLHSDYHADVEEVNKQLMLTDKASNFKHRNIYSKTEKLIETEISSIRINNINGKPVILSVLRDMTERKQAEEVLIRSEKLSVVGQLAAGVAHEIRNPLTSLKGFTQLLKEKFKNQDTETMYFDIMEQELDRINLIVNEFMTLAKPNLNQFNNGNLLNMLQSVISILETQAVMTNVTLIKRYMEDVPLIYCNENQLKQLFLNIIKNAIEAMPDGGEVRITIRSAKNNHLLIQIKDKGTGIPQTIIDKINEPFFTTKENGTGLGLMISQRIVESHKGSFYFCSKEGVGTTVDIYLPISDHIQ